MRVEANLVHYGAVTLQDHESPVYHTTRASLKEEHDVGLFIVTLADKIRELRVTEMQVCDKDSLKQTHTAIQRQPRLFNLLPDIPGQKIHIVKYGSRNSSNVILIICH